MKSKQRREKTELEQVAKQSPAAKDKAPQQVRGTSSVTVALGLAAAAAILGLILYGLALNGPFVLDDRYQFFGRPEAAQMGFSSWVASVRPLLNASFWLNYQISATDTASYHFINVLLHALNTALVFVLSRRLWQWTGGQSNIAPIAMAALFLVHPLQTESVAYVSSRSETLSVLFAYLALALHITAPRDEPLSIARIAGMLAALAGAVLTKEHTAVLPAVFLLIDYFWRGGFAAIRINWRLHAATLLGGVLALGFVLRTLANSPSAGFSLNGITPLVYFATQCRMFWRYVRMFVLPVGQNVDPDIAFSTSLADPAALASLAAVVALCAAAWYLRQRAPLAAFGILLFGILLAPTSSFVPILDPFAERRVYLPFIGICCIALEALRRWRIPTAAIALVLAVFAVATFQRNAVWASELDLWRNAVAGSPEKYRPRFQLAFAHYTAGHCPEAAREFEAAAKLEPKQGIFGEGKRDVTLYVDWALSLDCMGNLPGAVARIREAALIEDSAAVAATEGMLLAKQSQYEAALAALARAEQRDPQMAVVYVYRGNIYRLQGRPEDARTSYQRALQIDPSNSAARQSLRALR